MNADERCNYYRAAADGVNGVEDALGGLRVEQALRPEAELLRHTSAAAL